MQSQRRGLVAEFLGTGALLATVVGSGVMAETLANGNHAIALLANAVATGAILYVLIECFGPVSGAHFNPAVTLAFAVRGETPLRVAAAFVVVQIAGAAGGVALAHAMFDLPLVQTSLKARHGLGQLVGELVATFGLVLTIFGFRRFRPDAVPAGVALYILAAYWFTSSTSFANPAVTLARTLTDTFAGIRPEDAPAFVVAQLLAAGFASVFAGWLFVSGPRIGAPNTRIAGTHHGRSPAAVD